MSIPGPDKVYRYLGKLHHPDLIDSDGYYRKCFNAQCHGVKVSEIDRCRVFAIARQFNSYALPSHRENSMSCCDNKNSFFEYQGVRMPIHHVPQLQELFIKYQK